MKGMYITPHGLRWGRASRMVHQNFSPKNFKLQLLQLLNVVTNKKPGAHQFLIGTQLRMSTLFNVVSLVT